MKNILCILFGTAGTHEFRSTIQASETLGIGEIKSNDYLLFCVFLSDQKCGPTNKNFIGKDETNETQYK